MEIQEILLSPTKDPSSIYRFKDDIVNALYQIEDKMNNKTHSLESLLTSKLSVFESRINNLDKNINEIVIKQKEMNKQTEVSADLLPTQIRHEESIISHEIRLNSLQKDITNACYKYDKIFIDNLILPGQIGDYCKYKNVRECFDYILTQIIQFNTYKDKVSCENKLMREKNEQNLKSVYCELEIINKTNINYTKNQIDSFQMGIDSKIEEYYQLIQRTKTAYDEEKLTLKIYYNEIKEHINRLMSIKEEIEEKNNKVINEVEKINNSTLHHYNQISNELTKLNQFYTEISEQIKDIKSKKKSTEKNNRVDLKILANDLHDDDSNINTIKNNNHIVSSVNGLEIQTLGNMRKTNNNWNTKQHCSLDKDNNYHHFSVNNSLNDIKIKNENKKNTSLDNNSNILHIKNKYHQNSKQKPEKKAIKESKARKDIILTISTIKNKQDYPNLKNIEIQTSKPDLLDSVDTHDIFTHNIENHQKVHSLKIRKSIKNKKQAILSRNYTSDKNIKQSELVDKTFNETLKIHSIPVKPRENVINKLTKKENGQFINTSVSSYFNPHKNV